MAARRHGLHRAAMGEARTAGANGAPAAAYGETSPTVREAEPQQLTLL